MPDKYKFTKEQHFAVWEAYEGQCYWCGRPLELKESTVDHVIAEKYEGTPDLARIKTLYGLDDSFQINDYCNWVLAHMHCNFRKGDDVFGVSPALIACLHDVAKRGARARERCRTILAGNRKDKVLGRVGVAIDTGVLKQEDILEKFGLKLVRETEIELPPGFCLHVPGYWKIMRLEGEIATVSNGERFGRTPVGPEPDYSWLCGNCKEFGPWNGAMCLTCGCRSCPD